MTTYGELYARLRKRYLALLESSEQVRQARQALLGEAVLTDQYVASVGEVQGFREEWMTEQDSAARAKGAQAGAATVGRTLPAMMAAAAKAEPQQQPARVHITVGMAKAGALTPVPAPAPAPAMVLAQQQPKAAVPNPAMVPIQAQPAAAVLPAGGPVVQAAPPLQDAVPADGGSGGAEPPAMCVICQQNLVQEAGDEVQMLACGHAFHRMCLEDTWEIGQHERGWCPMRCDVRRRAAAANFAAMNNMDEVTTEEIEGNVEQEQPAEPQEAPPVVAL